MSDQILLTFNQISHQFQNSLILMQIFQKEAQLWSEIFKVVWTLGLDVNSFNFISPQNLFFRVHVQAGWSPHLQKSKMTSFMHLAIFVYGRVVVKIKKLKHSTFLRPSWWVTWQAPEIHLNRPYFSLVNPGLSDLGTWVLHIWTGIEYLATLP